MYRLKLLILLLLLREEFAIALRQLTAWHELGNSIAIFTVRLQIGIVWSKFGVVEFIAYCIRFAQFNYRLGSLVFRYAFQLINPHY